MTIGPGTRIGPYRITELVADGGLGQVWRARHTLLNRDDALKVLSDVLASDPRRLERFEHEAQVLAALNHPNIARVYNLEQAGGARALAMELVEGPTLADRLAAGPVPLDEALMIARQVADAIETAHRHGIVHGHLKPSVVKVLDDGTVKVLGFGHARADTDDISSATTSPSLTPVPAVPQLEAVEDTDYASPEQMAGGRVDKRADLWSFGAILMAMLTGRPPFERRDNAISHRDATDTGPDWTALPERTPGSIRRLLRRCLEPDRRQRLADMTNARLELEDAVPELAREPQADPHPAGSPIRLLLLAVVVTALVTAAATWWLVRPSPIAQAPVARFTIVPPPSLPLTSLSLYRDIAVAPDGSFLVYASGTQGRLVVRRFDRLEATPLAGVTGATTPFVSPDGRWVGYYEDYTTLRKVAVAGGGPITLTRLPGTPRGAAWVDDATIIVATASPTSGLLRVAAAGGEDAVTELTRPDQSRGELGHWQPSVLPGGRAILFTVATAQPADSRIEMLDLETGRRTTLLHGGRDGQYAPSGHLIYTTSGGTLLAVTFDPDRQTVGRDPVPVVTGVSVGTSGAANAVVSPTGLLVYVPSGEGGVPARSLVWVDRQGRESPLPTPPRAYVSPRLSPDGRQVALEVRDQEQDIWLWDLAGQSMTRLTTDPAGEAAPVWTPDGARVIFGSTRSGALNVFARLADGSQRAERLTTSPNAQAPTSVTPDGASLIAHEVRSKTARDLIRVQIGGGGASNAIEDLIATSFDELNGSLSPDGRYLAYQSDESGRTEIYVRPYPRVTAGRTLVSIEGGTQPAWTRDGRELIYLDASNRLTAVAVDTSEGNFNAGIPRTVLPVAYATPAAYRTYDVSPDGSRFLVIKEQPSVAGSTSASHLVVVQHWSDELTRLIRR